MELAFAVLTSVIAWIVIVICRIEIGFAAGRSGSHTRPNEKQEIEMKLDTLENLRVWEILNSVDEFSLIE